MKTPISAFYLSCFLAFVSGHTVNYTVILFSQDVIDSDLLSGIGFALCFGPPIILGWYAGVLCDRLSPGRIIVFSQITFIISGVFLLLADQFAEAIVVKSGFVIIAAFLAGCGWSFIAPARFAALGQIVAPGKLHGATVILNTLSMVGFGAAPIIIGEVLKIYGWSGVIITFMLGFVLATLLIFFSPTSNSNKQHKPVLAEIRIGLNAVLKKPILYQLLLASIVFYTIVGPMQVLLPRIASKQLLLSEVDRGYYLGILAIALILGGALCMAFRNRMHDGRTILCGSLITALGIMAISRLDVPLLSGLTLLISGTISGVVASLIVAGLQEEASDEIRGRVMSMYTITSQVIPALSGLFAGVLSQYMGVAFGLFVCGGLIIVATSINFWRLDLLRTYNRIAET